MSSTSFPGAQTWKRTWNESVVHQRNPYSNFLVAQRSAQESPDTLFSFRGPERRWPEVAVHRGLP